MKDKEDKFSITSLIVKTRKQRFIEYKCSSIIDKIIETKRMRWIEGFLKHYKRSICNAIVTPKQIYKQWMDIGNDLQDESKLKIFFYILWLTIKDCIIIYMKLFLESLFLVGCFSILMLSVLYLTPFAIRRIFLYICSISSDVSKDAWLGFIGNILGGIITILGIAITLKSERKRDRLNNIEQSKPIIILERCVDSLNTNEKETCASCSLSFLPIMSEKESVHNVRCPYIFLKNIGFNLALNVELNIIIEHLCSAAYSEIDSIETKEKVLYGIDVSFLTEALENFERVFKKTEKEPLPHADFLRMRMFFRLEIDKIDFVASDPAIIVLQYQDVYGIKYTQKHYGRFYITRSMDKYYACIRCENYSISEIAKR